MRGYVCVHVGLGLAWFVLALLRYLPSAPPTWQSLLSLSFNS